jgi:hypothetical protein
VPRNEATYEYVPGPKLQLCVFVQVTPAAALAVSVTSVEHTPREVQEKLPVWTTPTPSIQLAIGVVHTLYVPVPAAQPEVVADELIDCPGENVPVGLLQLTVQPVADAAGKIAGVNANATKMKRAALIPMTANEFFFI